MKLKCTRGFGLVEGPDGEQINVEDTFEVDEDTAEYILQNYPGMEVVEAGTSAANPEGKGGEDANTEICGAEMTDGSICERPADECPYHG